MYEIRIELQGLFGLRSDIRLLVKTNLLLYDYPYVVYIFVIILCAVRIRQAALSKTRASSLCHRLHCLWGFVPVSHQPCSPPHTVFVLRHAAPY